MKNRWTLGTFFLLFVAGSLFPLKAAAKEAPCLSKKNLTLRVGDTSLITLRNNGNNLTSWQVVSGSKKISLSCRISYGELVIRARKKGKAKIQATVGSKRYILKIKVKKAKGARKVVLTKALRKKAGISLKGQVKVPKTFRYKKKKYKITAIGSDCFGSCKKMTSIRLPSTVTSLASGAFHDCPKLTSVTFSKNLVDMGNSVFYRCQSLKEAHLPEKLVSIGTGVFESCLSLERVTFEGSLKTLPASTFIYCKALTEVNLSQDLTYIGKKAFLGCQSLQTLALPDSLIEADQQAFDQTTTSFSWKGTNYKTSQELLAALGNQK